MVWCLIFLLDQIKLSEVSDYNSSQNSVDESSEKTNQKSSIQFLMTIFDRKDSNKSFFYFH